VPLRPRFAVEAWQEPVDLLARGWRAFDTRRYYEAQVLWEAEALAAVGERQAWLRGLSALAGGMVAASEHRHGTATRLVYQGRRLLVGAPAELDDVDLAAVRATAEAALLFSS